MLPDRSLLIRQKLVENDKNEKFKRDILSNIQTMYSGYKSHKSLIFIHFVRFGVKVNFSLVKCQVMEFNDLM